MSSKVSYCACEHKFQDERYGQGKRLFTPMKKDGMYRCTVCGREKQITSKKDEAE